MTRFRAAWATQDAHGCAVAPSTRIRRMWCSITASTNIRVPDRVTASKKSQAKRASAWERRKSAQVVDERSGAGVDPGFPQQLPHGGRGDLHPEHEQFAVQPPIPPAGVLPGQAQY